MWWHCDETLYAGALAEQRSAVEQHNMPTPVRMEYPQMAPVT